MVSNVTAELISHVRGTLSAPGQSRGSTELRVCGLMATTSAYLRLVNVWPWPWTDWPVRVIKTPTAPRSGKTCEFIFITHVTLRLTAFGSHLRCSVIDPRTTSLAQQRHITSHHIISTHITTATNHNTSNLPSQIHPIAQCCKRADSSIPDPSPPPSKNQMSCINRNQVRSTIRSPS